MAPENNKKSSLDRETCTILAVVCLGVLFSLMLDQFYSSGKNSSTPTPTESDILAPNQVSLTKVPLATGEEPIEKLFTQSGCPVCHTIPGIRGAKGREGPKLVLGATASLRLQDPNYQGLATTEREYIAESILTPGAFVVSGYPDRVMPRWYGKKISAAALEKMVSYLEQLTDGSS